MGTHHIIYQTKLTLCFPHRIKLICDDLFLFGNSKIWLTIYFVERSFFSHRRGGYSSWLPTFFAKGGPTEKQKQNRYGRSLTRTVTFRLSFVWWKARCSMYMWQTHLDLARCVCMTHTIYPGWKKSMLVIEISIHIKWTLLWKPESLFSCINRRNSFNRTLYQHSNILNTITT